MEKNRDLLCTNSNIIYSNNFQEGMVGSSLEDSNWLVFDLLFNQSKDIGDRCEYLILKVQSLISENKLDKLESIVSSSDCSDLDPSLLYTLVALLDNKPRFKSFTSKFKELLISQP